MGGCGEVEASVFVAAMEDEASSLLQGLHGKCLRAVCSSNGDHWEGLGTASRALAFRGPRSPGPARNRYRKWIKDLANLDIVAAWIRHVTKPKVCSFLEETAAMLALCARDGCRDGQARVSRPRASTSMQAGGGRDLLAEEAAAFFCIFSEDDDDMVVNTEFRRTALHGGDAAAGPPLAGYVCCHEFPDQALEVLNTFVHFGAPCAGVAEPGQLRRRMRSCPTSLAGDPGEAADLTNVLGVAEEWPQLVLEDGESDWTRDGEGVRLEPLVLESPIADGDSPVRMPLVDGTRASDGQFEAFPAWQQYGADVPSQDPCYRF